jgi:hypothetical protein
MDARRAPIIRSTAIVLLLGMGAVACQRRHETAAATAVSDPPGPSATLVPASPSKRCLVFLHGKSGVGRAASVTDGVTRLNPGGNAPGWGGLQWAYYPEDGYRVVRGTVAKAITDAGCGRVIVHGFSNGGAAAGKLYCRGETFGGTVLGYVLDDPVPDHSVERCTPAPGVKARLYWTGALTLARDGWQCVEKDWTCEGGSTIGVDRYARLIGVPVASSIHGTHEMYDSPPEYALWWSEGER